MTLICIDDNILKYLTSIEIAKSSLFFKTRILVILTDIY